MTNALPPETAAAISHLRRVGKNHRLLTKEEEIALAKRIKKGDDAARHELALHNLRLVTSVALKCLPASGTIGWMTLEDLFGYGVFGLYTAVDKFDARRGNRFSTMATWWVRQAILRKIHEHARLVYLPGAKIEAVGKMLRTREALVMEVGREPTREEVATKLGWTAEKMQQIELVESATTLDLDAPAPGFDDDGENLTLLEVLAAPEPEAPELPEGLAAAIENALAELAPQECWIVRASYGLGTPPRTAGDLARVTGLTRWKVVKIRAAAVRKLREIPELARFVK